MNMIGGAMGIEITAKAGSEHELKAVLRTLKKGVSIDDYEIGLELDEDGNLAGATLRIECGGYVSSTEAAEILGVSKGRVSQLVSAGLLGGRTEGSVAYVRTADVLDRLANPPAPHRPVTALGQSFDVWDTLPSGGGKGEYLEQVATFEDVKDLADLYDGVYAVGTVDKIPFVQPPG